MAKNKSNKDYYRIAIIFLITVFFITGFVVNKKNENKTVSKDLKWSERMAQSIMLRNPEPWQLEFNRSPKWSYTHALVLSSMTELYKETDNEEYMEYVRRYADTMVQEDGSILTYDITEFNIDHINPGNVLLDVMELDPQKKYEIALTTLRKQIEWQPRTTNGGFWHKLRYPWQMWLDGLYMGSPFYVHYASIHGEKECFDDVVNQFVLMEKVSRDPETGLLYHGWDESKVQLWSNPENGCSPNFWGRAMGWYAMGIVDVLDYLPEDHPGRKDLTDILKRLVDALVPYQHESGLWYQVIDMGDKDGNYLEASASSMFTYAIAKATNKGYLDESYKEVAEKCYNGIIKNLIKVDENGLVTITEVCSVAGLGGNPFRDGSYEYYISEPKRDNDPKATGPFILASIELNK